MTSDRKKQLLQNLSDTMTGIKKNPNHYPIIDKWNNRIFQKNKFAAFNIIEQAIEKEIDEMFQKRLDSLVSYKDLRCKNANNTGSDSTIN